MIHLLVKYIDIWNGYFTSFLDICSLTVLLFGIIVIIIKNPIASLMGLIGVYGFISLYLISTGLTFIGFSYLIVYIGAVSILFLFILMLINIRTSELQSNNWNSVPLASSIIIFLNFVLLDILPYTINNFDFMNLANDLFNLFSLIYTFDIHNFFLELLGIKGWSIMDILYVTSNSWDGNITETSHISSIGNIMYTAYNIWLFMSSLILVLAMVGAIIITIKQGISSTGGAIVLHTRG